MASSATAPHPASMTVVAPAITMVGVRPLGDGAGVCAGRVPLDVVKSFMAGVTARQPGLLTACLYRGETHGVAASDESNVKGFTYLADSGYSVFQRRKPTTAFPEGVEYTYQFGTATNLHLLDVTVSREQDGLYYVTGVAEDGGPTNLPAPSR